MPAKKTGRPKIEPERKRLTAHVLPETHRRISGRIDKGDNALSSSGKVIDEQFRK